MKVTESLGHDNPHPGRNWNQALPNRISTAWANTLGTKRKNKRVYVCVCVCVCVCERLSYYSVLATITTRIELYVLLQSKIEFQNQNQEVIPSNK
jgi:hypothetical protein